MAEPMINTTFQLPTPDRISHLHVHAWQPASPRATLLIVHGMAEHGARYARLAAALNAAGMAVYAPDLPGHGLSARTEDRGHFADRDGWSYALACIDIARREIAVRHPDLPLFFLGHSMGSFLGQHYLVEHGNGLAGAVLSATSGSLGGTRAIGRMLMELQCLVYGPRHPSALAEALSFKTFNKRFDQPAAPARTPFDWLSRDPVEVDRYIADPLCGFCCSARLWADLLGAGASLRDAERLARIPKDLPILLIAGSDDPVSQGGSGPNRLTQAYRRARLNRVECSIYPLGRHELLNDTCRDAVTQDLIDWFTARVLSRGQA